MSATTKPAAVVERPILFSAPLVRAILAGTKTVTRRLIRPQPQGVDEFTSAQVDAAWGAGFVKVRCPFGDVGTRLWVREAFRTWCKVHDEGGEQPPFRCECQKVDCYRADHPEIDHPYGWRPSIHMPRWASRIDLEVTAVSVERLQEITEEDARAEGVGDRFGFKRKWDELNGDRASWAASPWVWVVRFRRIRP